MDILNQLFNSANCRDPSFYENSNYLSWTIQYASLEFSKNGQYSINSGYKVAKLCEKKVKGDEETSERKEKEEQKCWKGIWRLNIKKKYNISYGDHVIIEFQWHPT